MIDVLASIRVKSGQRDTFVAKFNANVPAVLAEDGCISYYPAIDIDSGLDIQEKDPNVVTVVEKWESVAHLDAHLKAPHMVAFRDTVKDIVEGLTLKVVQQA